MIELLLNAGADKGVKDVFDDTTAQMAIENPALKDHAVLGKLMQLSSNRI